MRGIAAGLAVAILGIAGGTVVLVYGQAKQAHERAVARCLGAGGAWLPRSAASFAGTCLAHPGALPADDGPGGAAPP